MITGTRTRRIAAVGAISLTAALALTACGGAAETDPNSPLLMYTWVSGDGDAAQWQAFVDKAKEADPEIADITFEGPSFADYWTKVKTRLSGGDQVCLLTTQAARAQELKSLLMPLDDLIAESDLDTSEIDKSMLEGMTVDGTIRAIPYDAEPMVLFYNADAFRAAGLELPGADGYSREQFLSDAKALTTDSHFATGLTTGMFNANAWALADGVPAVTAEGELDLTNPEFVNQIQGYFDLAAQENITKSPEAGESGSVVTQQFTNGEVDMVIDGPWMYSVFADGADFELGITSVPSTSGVPAAMTAGSGFGIAQGCDRPEEAFTAIVALTSTEVQEQQAAAQGIVPARIEALDAWGEGKPAEATEVIEGLLENATAQITTEEWTQVDTLFTQYSVQGFRGDKDAEEILTTIQEAAVR